MSLWVPNNIRLETLNLKVLHQKNQKGLFSGNSLEPFQEPCFLALDLTIRG